MNAASRWKHWLRSWWDVSATAVDDADRRIDIARILPFIALHLACLAIWWVGVSLTAVLLCLGLFYLRMFAITAVYHRLLAHRSYHAPRWLCFLGAVVANSAAQRGPLWWAAHHRHHHRHSDTAADIHRPSDGFWESHLVWFLRRSAFRTRMELLPDWRERPELRFLDRYDVLAPIALALACFAFGALAAAWWPALGTDGWQCLIWGFCLSTVLCFHATFTINSLAHTWGSRPFATTDGSRNNLLLAVLTMGEGWHNNHHYYQGSARQGFRWYEIDPTWYILRVLQALGLVSGLKPVPARVLAQRRSS